MSEQIRRTEIIEVVIESLHGFVYITGLQIIENQLMIFGIQRGDGLVPAIPVELGIAPAKYGKDPAKLLISIVILRIKDKLQMKLRDTLPVTEHII